MRSLNTSPPPSSSAQVLFKVTADESTGPLLIAGDAIAFGGTHVVGRCARVP